MEASITLMPCSVRGRVPGWTEWWTVITRLLVVTNAETHMTCQHHYNSAKLELPSPPSLPSVSHIWSLCIQPSVLFPCIASNPQLHAHNVFSDCVNSQPCCLSVATKYSLFIQRVNTLSSNFLKFPSSLFAVERWHSLSQAKSQNNSICTSIML